MSQFVQSRERGHFLQGLAMILAGLGALFVPISISSQPKAYPLAFLLFAGSLAATALRLRTQKVKFVLLAAAASALLVIGGFVFFR